MYEEILSDKALKFNELESKIFKFVCEIGCLLLKTTLEDRDKEIARSRDKRRYRHKGYKRDCIKTIMGEVEYKKAIYELDDGKTKKYVFLLNEEMDIHKVGKVSANLAEVIIDSACENSYRKSSKFITKTTNQSISHEGVRNVVLKVGEKISDTEKQKARLYKEEKLVCGTKDIPILFEEADGLWISLQGKDREKIIKKRKESAKRSGKEYKVPKSVKSELKLYVSYEGWLKDKRHTLVNKKYITGFIARKELHKIRVAKLHEIYNFRNIKVKVMNGDGAKWIKKLVFRDQFYQKDSFHISQAINRNISDKSNREKLKELIKGKRYGEINEYLEDLKYECGGEEKQIKKLNYLQHYLKDGLERYKDAVKDIPEAPDGMEYRGLGTAETQIFTVLSRRFSDRRMSFSKKGATMLSKVVAFKLENDNVLECVETPIKIDNTIENWIKEIENCVEKSKKDKKVKLKESSSIKILSKPFEGSILTSGRKEIRSMCSIKCIY